MGHSVEVELVAAFTSDGAGGNLAGVVCDAGKLDREQRQRIAAEVAVSETAFVERRGDDVYAVEFYTPNKQVPDCGHATVATFGLLSQRGALPRDRAVKRTIAGDRAIIIEGDRIFMEQPRATAEAFGDAAEFAAALGLHADDVTAQAVVADNGVRFVLVPTTRDALPRAVPNAAAISALTERADAIGLYVYAPADAPFDATIRMFAPRYGIPEESATGMAAGILGSWLGRDEQTAAFRFAQGVLSPQPSPSDLTVRLTGRRVLVGGSAALVRTLQLA